MILFQLAFLLLLTPLAGPLAATMCRQDAGGPGGYALSLARSAIVHIRGTVTNGTTHKPVAGAPVALEALRGGGTTTVARGRADAHGRFALDALPLSSPDGGYAVVATYKGVAYGAPIDARRPSRPLAVSVYDTTSSDTVLIAPLAQVGMTRTSRGLQVAEEWTVVNPTSVTDVGGDAATGRGAAFFPVPAGATNVVVVPGAAPLAAPATVVRGAVAMNAVVRPATGRDAASFHQVKFAFTLPYGPGAGHPTLRIPTRYLIGSLEVFALPPATLTAPGFARTTLNVGSGHVGGWQAQAIAPNTTTSIGIDGPPALLAPVGPPLFPFVSVSILVGGGFAILLLLSLSSRAPSPAAADGATRGPALSEGMRRLQRERARLVTAIAELDLQHARGRVSPARYARRRAREKDRLRDVARRLGG